ncbi:MAG: bacillithiol biosynthesis deacetylase BshB1 [Candidatus Accumulibacter phosphatis]|uniref:Bacillithiol biosynthesis deacetylase BshB1 n=1 Tax=Candidatus Accumulibacter phosphatis TaxID=327160 RepID=A0A080LZX3_9PROT|nr:MAG: bacillithiol biosynthesis deacetylase BshB1 [Candidatus Accumulibacter phosphatis]
MPVLNPMASRSFEALRGKAVLVLSAHCDDAPIGCGGTLLRLTAEMGGECEFKAVVFSGGDDAVRVAEEEDAMRSFGISLQTVYPFTDSQLPDHWFDIKREMLDIRDKVGSNRIGLILCPRLEDRHQDHRVIAENAWRVFRQHLILEYEIPKYESDLGHPNVYVTLDATQAQAKVDRLLHSYPSRRIHHWWSREIFLSLMRVRGVEANCTFAEGLYARKWII